MIEQPLAGRRCLVVGSAPLASPLAIPETDYVVAVNGGISSVPRVDAWVLNSRNISASSWSPGQRRLSDLMLKQGANRTVPLALFLTKHEDAATWTLSYLRKQGTRILDTLELNNDGRRRLEADAGARTPDMTKHALSAGLFAAAWCFHRGAAAVRLEGFSWEPGYAYLPGEKLFARGHTSGDREALRRLSSRYPGRLIHSLAEETTMAKATPTRTATRPAASRASTASGSTREQIRPAKAATSTPARTAASRATASGRPSAERVADARASRSSAKDALSPAAERQRRVERKQEEAARRPRRDNGRLQVRATELTFYNNKRRRPGEVFELREETDFRESCMEWADAKAREAVVAPIDQDGAKMRAADLDRDDEAAEIVDQLDENEQGGEHREPANPLGARAAGRRAGKPSDDNPLGVE